MQDCTARPLEYPVAAAKDVLTQVLREGAQRMLAQAIEAEVAEWVAARRSICDEQGRRAVVRNGYLPERQVLTSLGPVGVRQPRVRDRRARPAAETFQSRILPRYLRKSQSIEDLVPWLYLKGVSTGQFGEALQALVGADPEGLSAATVGRLLVGWQKDYQAWSGRSLKDKQYVYVWADGVYFNIRLEDAENAKQCILVLMGARSDGVKELIAIQDGYRESTASWLELLRDCRQRGLTIEPHLAIGDGGLGFWAALGEVYPGTRTQRCWVHKIANVLNKLPQGVQGRAKRKLQNICMAATREAAQLAFDRFVGLYEAKYPKAVECLTKDREALMTFYDFPAENWIHIRTTNPIESTFATVRLRHNRTKGNGSRTACLAMVFKLCEAAERNWRAINGADWLPQLIAGAKFNNGIQRDAA
jgi:transposase-like protein